MRTLLTAMVGLLSCATLAGAAPAGSPTRPPDVDVGAFYFPGWHSKSPYWNDLKGLPGSRSPGKAWPERTPLLGYYAEEDPAVAQAHIDWAREYGVDFFAFDWYWNGVKTELDHALRAFLLARDRRNVRFCLMWANHSDVPRTRSEFDQMVEYWIANYLADPGYYRLMGKPLVFVFDAALLDRNAQKFGESVKSLLARADAAVRAKGLPGISFVAITNDMPSDPLEDRLLATGFRAYTAWNYVVARNASPVAEYDSMVETYLEFYRAAARTKHKLAYLVPASPGWDKRPWRADKPFVHVREHATPQKFERMLVGARALVEREPGPRILMIEAWNEFGEGSYIEPTKGWGTQYLDTLRNVFGVHTGPQGRAPASSKP